MNVFIALRDLFIDLLHAYSAFADDPITETVPKPQSDRRHGHCKYGGLIRRTLHTEVVEPFLKAASQLEAEENLCSVARVIMPGAKALLGFQVRRGRDDAMVGGR